MTDRLERALAAMLHDTYLLDESYYHAEDVARPALATPTGLALRALVEAAEAWWPSQLTGHGKDDRLNDALRAFRALTDEPTGDGGERS